MKYIIRFTEKPNSKTLKIMDCNVLDETDRMLLVESDTMLEILQETFPDCIVDFYRSHVAKDCNDSITDF